MPCRQIRAGCRSSQVLANHSARLPKGSLYPLLMMVTHRPRPERMGVFCLVRHPSDYMVCVLQWKNSEPIAVLQQFVHACYDLLSGKSDVNMFAQELCSALDWTMNHCFSIQDKKHFDWDESRSGCKAESVASNGHHNYFEKDGCHQSTIKLREDLINIDSEKRDLELENQKSCCEELEATCLELQLQLESMTKKEIPSSEHHREESQLWTVSSCHATTGTGR